MSFLAKCTFCPTTMTLPQTAMAASVRCPQCGSYFTAVPAPANLKTAQAQTSPQATTEAPAQPSAKPVEGIPVSRPKKRKPARAPIVEHPSPLPEIDDAPRPSTTVRSMNVVGAIALIVAALAFWSALDPAALGGPTPWQGALPWLHALTIPLSIVALLLGAIGTWMRRSNAILQLTPPILGGVMGLAVLCAAVVWPALLSISFHRSWDAPLEEIDGPRMVHKHDRFAKSDETSDWLDASAGVVKWKNAQITITGVRLTKTRIAGKRGKKLTKKRHLLITVRLQNSGGLQPLQFESWSDGEAPQLHDDEGEEYPYLNPRFKGVVDGWKRKGVLIPGDHLDDVLVFDVPKGKIDHWQLRLPASAWGSAGTLKIKIPRTMAR